MKNAKIILILLACVCAAGSAKGQYAAVLGNDNDYWNYPLILLEETYVETFYTRTVNDTLKEVLYEVDNETILFGMVYETGDHSRLYFLHDESDTNPVLIMDMDLSVGDSFPTTGEYGQDAYLIVDSIYYANNRKVIQFSERIPTLWIAQTPPPKRAFIEGVGPNWGFTPRLDGSPMGASYIICKHENNELVYAYEDAVFRDCEVVNGISCNTLEFSVFPNPFEDFVEVNCGHKGVVRIFDVCGNMCGEFPTGIEAARINLSGLSSGCYLFSFVSKNGKTSQLIIKK